MQMIDDLWHLQLQVHGRHLATARGRKAAELSAIVRLSEQTQGPRVITKPLNVRRGAAHLQNAGDADDAEDGDQSISDRLASLARDSLVHVELAAVVLINGLSRMRLV